ncbi:MAG: DUF3050 domain-containing protein [Owenweeksia sp.]
MTDYHILGIQQKINPLREKLLQHELYSHLNTPSDLQLFMENHVFAVWDFMVLLKALQIRLTSTSEAWVPSKSPVARRLINEIVLCEESDLDINGKPSSHYEMYLAGMKQSGADVSPVVNFVKLIEKGYSHKSMVKYNVGEVPGPIQDFLRTTLDIVKNGKVHEIAAAFTFGREDLIPDLFTEIVKDLDRKVPGKLNAFIYYLQRHIEVDGDEHGPMAYQMIGDLCGNDETLWLEAQQAACKALEARLKLWDAITALLPAPRQDWH